MSESPLIMRSWSDPTREYGISSMEAFEAAYGDNPDFYIVNPPEVEHPGTGVEMEGEESKPDGVEHELISDDTAPAPEIVQHDQPGILKFFGLGHPSNDTAPESE